VDPTVVIVDLDYDLKKKSNRFAESDLESYEKLTFGLSEEQIELFAQSLDDLNQYHLTGKGLI